MVTSYFIKCDTNKNENEIYKISAMLILYEKG